MVLVGTVNSEQQNFFKVSNLVTAKLYSFKVSAVNEIAEGPLSVLKQTLAMDVPGTPLIPYLIDSQDTSPTDAEVTIGWYPVTDTGGVPLSGYKLYQYTYPSTVPSLVYDGTNQPDILSATISGLVLDSDYGFFVTALNPSESEESEVLDVRAAGKPGAPGIISMVAGSMTGTSMKLQWTVPLLDGGSSITAYTLV